MYKINRYLLISCLILAITTGCSEKKASPTKPAEKKVEEEVKKPKASASNRKGKLVYKQYCVICHGGDGKLAISNATDLTTSTVELEERIDQITNGKGLMTPYKDILSEEQIRSVAEYLAELRQ